MSYSYTNIGYLMLSVIMLYQLCIYLACSAGSGTVRHIGIFLVGSKPRQNIVFVYATRIILYCTA